jgi:starch-binding outer membrane protein, SusD/RagB family
VPLYLSLNYQLNDKASKTAAAEVYDQIISDLKDAQNLLSIDYSFSNGERLRPNKWSATALLARTYLYTQKWDSAEAQSSLVINNGLYSLTPLDSTFLANSNEAIWQLQPVMPGFDTNEGENFILTAPPTDVSLSTFIMNAFEPNDNRLTQWVGTFSEGTNTWFFPYKYKIQTSSTSPPFAEYSMVLRLAEQYLIRAEARAEENTNIAGAQQDLNIIRYRAGLPNTTASDQSSLLTAIAHERQVELFSEWGHRWLDLIRTNKADAVLGSEKPTWKSYAKLYPIPSNEIQINSNVTQNSGY